MDSVLDWIWVMIKEYWISFLKGTGYTILMSIIGTVIGFVVGIGVAIIRTIPVKDNDNTIKKILLKIINFILTAYVEVIRGTPMLVQALLLHYGFLSKMDMPMLSAIIILSINTGAYMAEIVRGGIISIDKGQTEGAQAIGMTHFQTMFHVVLPQAIRNIMPSIGNEFVVNIKDSSILSVISITELMYVAKQAGGTYFQFIPAYLICAVVYFVLTFTVTRLLRLLEKKMDGKKNYTVFGSQSDPEAEIHVKENA